MDRINLTHHQLDQIKAAVEEAADGVYDHASVDFSMRGDLTVHGLGQDGLFRFFVLAGDACGPTFALELTRRAAIYSVPNAVRFREVARP